MSDAYLYDGLRTPFGRHAGALSGVRPDDLAAGLLTALLARHSAVEPREIADVILGCTNQAGEDARNVARMAVLAAGLPVEVPGQTVNRLCASGLAAVIDATRAIRCAEGSLYLAGGVESMSRAPFVMAKATAAFSREQAVFDSTIGARFPNPRVLAQHGADSMPETADNVARECGISRAEADRYAAASQSRYARAKAEGFFDGEIAPVDVPGRKGQVHTVTEDEHPRPDTTEESLAALRPLFKEGVVTAGNASGINDGAALLLLGDAAARERLEKAPLARLRAAAAAGVAPRVMGLGPVPAIGLALQRAGLTLADMDLIEINEAFAVQVLGCLKGLGLPGDDARVNVNGGAIAVGHPLGASGARLVLSTARELSRRGGRYAVVSLCIGMGQGLALVLENAAR